MGFESEEVVALGLEFFVSLFLLFCQKQHNRSSEISKESSNKR